MTYDYVLKVTLSESLTINLNMYTHFSYKFMIHFETNNIFTCNLIFDQADIAVL